MKFLGSALLQTYLCFAIKVYYMSSGEGKGLKIATPHTFLEKCLSNLAQRKLPTIRNSQKC